MNKQEFLEHAHIKDVNKDDYAIIEEVYANHPSISAVNGKDEIAAIYNLPGGMRIIKDMVPTAVKARMINEEILALKSRMYSLTEAYDRL